MSKCVMLETENDIICSNNHQKQQIKMVLLDEKFKKNERLICASCLDLFEEQINGLPFNKAQTKIQELKDKTYSFATTFIELNVKKLDDLITCIEQMKNDINKYIEQLKGHLNEWKKQLLDTLKQKSSYKLLEEIDNIYISNQKLFEVEKSRLEEVVSQTNQSQQSKACLHLKNIRDLINIDEATLILQSIFQDKNQEQQNQTFLENSSLQINITLCDQEASSQVECQKQNEIDNKGEGEQQSQLVMPQDQSLLQKEVETKEEIEQNTKLIQSGFTGENLEQSINQLTPDEKVLQEQIQTSKPTCYKLVSSVQQKESCIAIDMNKDGSVIAASFNNDIKVWKLQDGQMIDQKIILKGHEKLVFSITFSKKINWFVSGGMDNQIRLWIERDRRSWFRSHSWEGSKPYTVHTNSILCLVLNQNEDQLISSSCDNSIKVWSIKSADNSLQFQYSLDKHENQVFQISLNKTETKMVSCSQDKQIILWEMDNNNKWEFKYIIEKTIDDYGLRANFLSDDTILWCQYTQPFIYVFTLENEKYKEQPNLRIQLKSFDEDGSWHDFCFFPSKYNSEYQELTIKQNKYIYRISKNQNELYQYHDNVMEFTSASIYGTIQDNLQNIVVWVKNDQVFQIYQNSKI